MSADKATFEFVADGPFWKGTPVVNGHKILTAQHVDVSIDAMDGPVVTLKLLSYEGLNIILGETNTIVADETREALISMGWTPPEGGGQ